MTNDIVVFIGEGGYPPRDEKPPPKTKALERLPGGRVSSGLGRVRPLLVAFKLSPSRRDGLRIGGLQFAQVGFGPQPFVAILGVFGQALAQNYGHRHVG